MDCERDAEYVQAVNIPWERRDFFEAKKPNNPFREREKRMNDYDHEQ